MHHHNTFVRALFGLLLAAGALPACKLFKKTHPSGHLARTDSPAQYTEQYPDQTTEEWGHLMDPSRWSGESGFSARDTGTLHVWVRYMCTSPNGEFHLNGRLGVSVVGRPPIAPVPVSATAAGATLQGIPRGDFAPIVVNGPRPDTMGRGGQEINGYVYLFDLDVPQQTTVTLTGRLSADRPAQCYLNYEVRKD